jgi:hypothetical protein
MLLVDTGTYIGKFVRIQPVFRTGSSTVLSQIQDFTSICLLYYMQVISSKHMVVPMQA